VRGKIVYMIRLSALLTLWLLLGLTAMAQSPSAKPSPQPSEPASADGGKAAPRSDDESSSKDTKINLAPPAGEEGYAPGADPADSGVQEMTPWNPLKADRNVEIGNYYMTLRNYPAAISRYREALYWKKDDAMAQLRLGQALEVVGQYADARKNFEGYLRILPDGKFAPLARKSLEHMKGKADRLQKAEVPSTM